jgi:hypothetical protein
MNVRPRGVPRGCAHLFAAVIFLFAAPAFAQMGGGMGAGRAPTTQPTQSSPTRNTQVGPRSTGGGDDEDSHIQVTQRAEPQAAPPADPLVISPEIRERIGSDYDSGPPSAVGELQRSLFTKGPYYEESRGDYRFRFLPPLYLEHTRGAKPTVPGEPTQKDNEALYALLYYQRRSPDMDMDIVFPLAWHVRDRENKVFVLGPLAHRDAPFEHDNWLAPLVFEGERKDGGYFHSPLLLTTSHWGEKGAFTLAGTYFRDRTGSDVDWGVAPFLFHGDNGNVDGGRRKYIAIPPLLFYHNEHELDESQMTVVGPVISRTTAKRTIFDVAPLLFHIEGRPLNGGIQENHTTLFPFFHYGRSDTQELFVLPGYLSRVTNTENGTPAVNTKLSLFVSHATTRNGSTSMWLGGPVVPLYYHYADYDTGLTSWFVAPFYFHSSSPTEHAFLTPLVGRFEETGISRMWWFFPSLTVSSDLHGWETDLLPIAYVGRSDESSHTVLAPIFWDFANPKSRTTVGFPVFWRFQDNTDSSITQIAANTLYRQKRVTGGLDWEFHVLPLFSYGENPEGFWWNVLFGLAGYDREGSYARIKAFWIPITVSGPSAPPGSGVGSRTGAVPPF